MKTPKKIVEIRVVFDTNTFIEYIAGENPSSEACSTAIRVCHSFVVSTKILEEYFKKLVDVKKYSGLEIMQKLRNADKAIDRGVKLEVDIAEKDQHIVEAAIASKAKYIVTKDVKHLISKKKDLKKKHNIEVLSPEEYIAKFSDRH